MRTIRAPNRETAPTVLGRIVKSHESRLPACLNANAETANGRSIPQGSLWFGKAFDETTECPYGGVGGLDVLGTFKVRTIFTALPSYVEGYHFSAKALYERLKILLRVDVQINVQKVCG